VEIPVTVGIILDIIVVLVLIFSFIGGLRGGAIKEFCGLVAFIIALPLVGVFIGYISPWFNIVGDANWRAFLSFLVTMGIIILILYLLFWIPRHLLEKIWNGGFFWSLLGGIFGALNSALGLVLLVTLLDIYPLLGSFDSALNMSPVLNWLVGSFGAFILSLMHTVKFVLPYASIFSCAA
jgi:uncharacterized membrane protein required for colicin V production